MRLLIVSFISNPLNLIFQKYNEIVFQKSQNKMTRHTDELELDKKILLIETSYQKIQRIIFLHVMVYKMMQLESCLIKYSFYFSKIICDCKTQSNIV